MSVMFTADGGALPLYATRRGYKPYVPVRERHFPTPPIVRVIIEQVAYDHGVKAALITSPAKWREVSRARFDAMYRLRALRNADGNPRFSLPHIGWLLGGRDHSTVKNGISRWEKHLAAKREAVAA
ncbi:MAG: hypothetical protein IT508_10975 [Burkholderiaceae bacterium]|nr:hypothetical protein [Burkholderiaceae bacterium]